jgi:hypothetical protein
MSRDYQNTPAAQNDLLAGLKRNSDYAEGSIFGYKGMNFSPYQVDTAHGLTSQRLLGTLIPVFEGDTIGRLWFNVGVVTATVTTIKVGLYSAIGTPARLAVSANTTTAMDALGITSIPLTTVYTVPAQGFIYAVLLVDAVTPGSVGGVAGSAGKATASTGGWPVSLAITQTGQTDLAATITPTLATTAMWWAWQ